MTRKKRLLHPQRARSPNRGCTLTHVPSTIGHLTLLVLSLLLLGSNANANTTSNCDTCQVTTVSPVTVPGVNASIPAATAMLPNVADTESLEDDLKMWRAIEESLRQWRQRKEDRSRAARDRQRAVNQTEQSKHETMPTSSPGGLLSRKRRDEESVCYKVRNVNYCFADKGPFDYLDTLPASPETIGTLFKLYTNKNRPDALKETAQYLHYDNESSLLGTHFNVNNEVKIIIHGFGSSSRRPWVLNITKALLDLGDFNVINVDWENGAKMPNYVQAAANTQLVGKQIAAIIGLINEQTPLTPTRYHLIGFSLGAHVAGFAGMLFTSPTLNRITGLDPASPLFEGYAANVRLDESDATFVDVIHSNGDGFIRGGLGSYTPMGHVDFYPNGGRVQVGCNSVLMGAITDIISGKWNSLCNHRRAFRFFLDSFKPTCTFTAFTCASYEDYVKGDCFTCARNGSQCAHMGYFAHQSKARGKMYLMTREGDREEPFCGNQLRVRLEASRDGQAVTWGKVDIQLVYGLGINETFTLSQEADEWKETEKLQSIVVARYELSNVTGAIVTYTKYKGWIYNGRNEWNLDRLEIMDSQGHVKTYCRPQTKLETGKAKPLSLFNSNCTLSQPQHLESNALAPSTAGHLGPGAPPPGPHAPLYAPGRPPYHPPPATGPHYPTPASQGVPVPMYPGPGYTILKAGDKPESASENDIDGAGSASNKWDAWAWTGNFFSSDDALDHRRIAHHNRTQLDQELMENHIAGGGGSPPGRQGSPGPTAASKPTEGNPNLDASSESSLLTEESSRVVKPTISSEPFADESAGNLLRAESDNLLLPGLLPTDPTPNTPRNRESRQRKWAPSPSSSPANYGAMQSSSGGPAASAVQAQSQGQGGSSGHHRSGRMMAQPQPPPPPPAFASASPVSAVSQGRQLLSSVESGLGPGSVEAESVLGGGGGGQPSGAPSHTRWTRASSYLRNRTTALLMRLLHQQPTHPSVGGGQGGQASASHPLGPLPFKGSQESLKSLLAQDGMDILTDYSTLAYYILSHPSAVVGGEGSGGGGPSLPGQVTLEYAFRGAPSLLDASLRPEMESETGSRQGPFGGR